MIKKELKNNVILSIKRNNRKELLLILREEDIAELQGGVVSHIGLNHNDCLEIHGNTPEAVIEYVFPYNPEVLEIIKAYELENVVLSVIKGDDLTTVQAIFEGLLRIFPRMVGNVNG